jgi:hypothetical protein
MELSAASIAKSTLYPVCSLTIMVNQIRTTSSRVNNRRLKGIFLLVSKSVRLNKLTPEQGHSSVFLNTNMLTQCEVVPSLFPIMRGRFEKRQTTTSS